MKRYIRVFLVVLMMLILVSCKSASGTKTNIRISPSSVVYREKFFARYNHKDLTDEEALDRFRNTSLQYLKRRLKQKFPEVDVKNKLEKICVDKGESYTLSDGEYDNIVLFIHGGAWVWELRASQVRFCDNLCNMLNAKVYMPMYPLAPEHTYEDTYAMLESLYDSLLKQEKPIYIVGDSAGGSIALGLVLKEKIKSNRLPDKVIVMSPCADASFENREIRRYESKDGMLLRAECLECAKLWARDSDLKIPAISPIFGNYKDFPETLMFVGDYDILYPDEMRLYDRMNNQGVKVSLVKGKGFWHVYPVCNIKEQKKCYKIIKDFCKK